MKQGKTMKTEFMRGGVITERAKGLSFGIQTMAKKYRKIHEFGLYYLSEIPPCKYCNPKWCSFWETHCKFIEGNYEKKQKQRYFGKKQTLVKNKPHWIG